MEEKKWRYYQDREEPDTIIRISSGKGEIWNYNEKTFVTCTVALDCAEDEWTFREISEEAALKAIRKYS